MISVTTTGQLAAAGFRVIPTPDQNPLHVDSVLSSPIAPAQAATLSALFKADMRPNSTYKQR